jgi:uncharacterized protein (DUF983 family)
VEATDLLVAADEGRAAAGPALKTLVGALARGRCPRCLEGRVFRGRVTMNERCPVCGLVFEREEGFFVGAMYVSYPLSIPILALMGLAWRLLVPSLAWHWVILLAGLSYVPLVPAVFRYSRLLWLYFDFRVLP